MICRDAHIIGDYIAIIISSRRGVVVVLTHYSIADFLTHKNHITCTKNCKLQKQYIASSIAINTLIQTAVLPI